MGPGSKVGLEVQGFKKGLGTGREHVSYSANSLKGGYIGIVRGDARSLDNGSCEHKDPP